MSVKIFNLMGEINDQASAEFTKFTTDVLSGNPKDNVVVTINSNGGSYLSAISIYNMIRALPNPVYTIIINQARSMAAIIALSTSPDRRFCLRDSNIYIHSIKVSRLEDAGIKELKRTLEEVTNFNSNIESIIKENTSIPEDRIHHVLLEDETDFLQYESYEMEELEIAVQLDNFESLLTKLNENNNQKTEQSFIQKLKNTLK